MPFDPVGYVETKIVDADGEVLRRAADILEERGWCQHFDTLGGRVCMVAAVHLAAGLQEWEIFPREDGIRLSKRLGFRCRSYGAKWNDRRGRTAAEVIARLRSAAERGAS